MKQTMLVVFAWVYLFTGSRLTYAADCSCITLPNPVVSIVRYKNLLFASTDKGYVYKINLKDNDFGSHTKVISLPYKRTVITDYRPIIFSTNISKNGKYLAISSSLGLITIYRLSDFSVAAKEKVPSEDAFSVKFLNNNELIFGTIDGTVVLWNFLEKKLIYKVDIGQFPIVKVAVSPDKEKLAVIDQSSIIKILDAATGKLEKKLIGHKESVNDLVFANSSILYSSSKDWRIIKWNLSTKRHLVVYKSQSDIRALCYDKNSANILFDRDYSVLFFNTNNLNQYKKMTCHNAPISQILCGNKVYFSAGTDSKICRGFE